MISYTSKNYVFILFNSNSNVLESEIFRILSFSYSISISNSTTHPLTSSKELTDEKVNKMKNFAGNKQNKNILRDGEPLESDAAFSDELVLQVRFLIFYV